MTVNAFLIFYIAVCHELGTIFETFKKSMTLNSPPDYESLLKEFHKRTRLVREIDDELSIIVFWATLANLISIYYALSIVVDLKTIPQIITMLYNLTVSIVMFFLTCYSASELSDIVHDLSTAAHMLPENLKMPPIKHLRFLFVVDKSVRLTVWKLFPLEKSYILASIGTIITYAVLVDNLLPKDK
ncbi:hypothetical protein JTE90_008503 [Oedothorax gibbosus]|uniref:Gustatory receptor n=1 Tax=Oedothorax gibbosus TaxID=931172 RepID=A0AAV6V105_9ARAC|nr:hypothetical protein JTE90_008503 [Oedothorax gibbosus]